jgi:hypothetical protein
MVPISGGICCLSRSGRYQHDVPKLQDLSPKVHGVVSQKTVILVASGMRTRTLARCYGCKFRLSIIDTRKHTDSELLIPAVSVNMNASLNVRMNTGGQSLNSFWYQKAGWNAPQCHDFILFRAVTGFIIM